MFEYKLIEEPFINNKGLILKLLVYRVALIDSVLAFVISWVCLLGINSFHIPSSIAYS